MPKSAANKSSLRVAGGHSPYRRDIDGLRALAVLSVVGFHAFPEWVKGGFVGVDIFFVISGFLISTILFQNLDANNFSFIDFYSRRIRRIFPALLIVLITLSVVGWYCLFANEYKQLGKHLMASTGFISNFVLWNESSYFDKAAETKLLLHLWSLGIEEQFYIIWPLLLWMAWKKRFNLFVLTLVFLLGSFTLNINGIDKNKVAVFYSPQTRFWELLIGSIIAYMTMGKLHLFPQLKRKFILFASNYPHTSQNLKIKNRHTLQSITGALLLLTGVCIITEEQSFPDWWAILPTFGAGMIISAGPKAWLNNKILSSPVLVWFGLISFPLYLWHWPLLSFMHIVKNEPLSLTLRIFVVLISIVLAWLTYILVENPIRKRKSHKVEIAVMIALMFSIGYGGYHIYALDGLPLRWNKNIQILGKIDNPFDEHFQLGTCFLKDWDNSGFDKCHSSSPSHSSPTLFLWGDSHAAHLYPGLKKTYGLKNSLTHLSLAGCPPFIDADLVPLACSSANSYILARIAKEKPDRVILSADWVNYKYDLITSTIEELKRLGIKNIAIIGPVPHWKSELPKLLSQNLRANESLQISKRLASGLAPNFKVVDSDMKKMAKSFGVDYISAADILCNSKGCLNRVEQSFETLITWDNAHLTLIGSEYLVSHFPKLAEKSA